MPSLFWASLRDDLTDLRRRIWNKRLKLWWYRFYIRRDEFHRSLNSDLDAMLVMDKQELERYFKDLYRRRKIAHQREFHRQMKQGVKNILRMKRKEAHQ
jgi:hypothetical protein